jgi:hypothetical protein
MKLISLLCLFILFYSCDKAKDDKTVSATLANTTWDFIIVQSTTVTWHADVIFYENGTTIYDEPDSPGLYTTYGTWSLSGNTLSYDMDASDSSNNYVFIGTISGANMNGTYSFGSETKTWHAVRK